MQEREWRWIGFPVIIFSKLCLIYKILLFIILASVRFLVSSFSS